MHHKVHGQDSFVCGFLLFMGDVQKYLDLVCNLLSLQKGKGKHARNNNQDPGELDLRVRTPVAIRDGAQHSAAPLQTSQT